MICIWGENNLKNRRLKMPGFKKILMSDGTGNLGSTVVEALKELK
jgi:hypothetical protein